MPAKSNTSEFIEKAKSVHGDRYDYSLVKYQKAIEKVAIICRKHGVFNQSPNAHLAGKGCIKCRNELVRESNIMSQDDFIKKAKSVHGDIYDYSDLVLTKANDNVNIICKYHGVFSQRGAHHLAGHGCSKCNRAHNSWRLSQWSRRGTKSRNFDGFKVYLILAGDENTGEYFIKIGRTYTKLDNRFYGFPYQYKPLFVLNGSAEEVWSIENKFIKSLKRFRVKPSIYFGGQNECFSISALDEAMELFEKSHLERVH